MSLYQCTCTPLPLLAHGRVKRRALLAASSARARADGSSGADTAATAGGAHERARTPAVGARARMAVPPSAVPGEAALRSAYERNERAT